VVNSFGGPSPGEKEEINRNSDEGGVQRSAYEEVVGLLLSQEVGHRFLPHIVGYGSDAACVCYRFGVWQCWQAEFRVGEISNDKHIRIAHHKCHHFLNVRVILIQMVAYGEENGWHISHHDICHGDRATVVGRLGRLLIYLLRDVFLMNRSSEVIPA